LEKNGLTESYQLIASDLHYTFRKKAKVATRYMVKLWKWPIVYVLSLVPPREGIEEEGLFPE